MDLSEMFNDPRHQEAERLGKAEFRARSRLFHSERWVTVSKDKLEAFYQVMGEARKDGKISRELLIQFFEMMDSGPLCTDRGDPLLPHPAITGS